ncbi:hypothetical protein V2W45_1446474 [Cenococcum geophilum]
MTISQHHVQCEKAFRALPDRTQAEASTFNDKDISIQDEFDRYMLWAGNVGASHSGNKYVLSLDYRLKEAPFYRDQVVKLLELLERHLHRAKEVFENGVTDEPVNWDSESGEGNISTSGMDDNRSNTSSWEISSDSDSETPSINQFPTSQNHPALSPLELEDSGSQLPVVLNSIRSTILCLYKLPIRRPAPLTRLRNAAEDEATFYEPFDSLYVRDKFPSLHKEVAIRLGKMITKRRQLLLYRKRHRDNMQPVAESLPVEEELKKRIVDKSERSSLPTIKAPSHARETQISYRSKATTLRTQPMPDEMIIPESQPATSVAASEFTRETPIHVPPRPITNRQKGSRMTFFECKYCRLLPTITSDLAWKRHVLADLQPYVCTFPSCDLPYHFFSSRDTWFEHEIQQHRVELFCNTPGHPSFQDHEQFARHMQDLHSVRLDLKSYSTVLRIFERSSRVSVGICNFCQKETKKMKLHVSRHLQQLALFAIPRADYILDDENIHDDSNVSQKNVEGSSEERKLDSLERESDTESEPSGTTGDPRTEVLDPLTKEVTEEYPKDLNQNSTQIPDTGDNVWDIVTNKFSRARAGRSDAPPIEPRMALDDSEILEKAVNRVITDLEERYNDPYISQEDFFTPPEFRHDSLPEPQALNPNGDVEITVCGESGGLTTSEQRRAKLLDQIAKEAKINIGAQNMLEALGAGNLEQAKEQRLMVEAELSLSNRKLAQLRSDLEAKIPIVGLYPPEEIKKEEDLSSAPPREALLLLSQLESITRAVVAVHLSPGNAGRLND